MVETDRKAVTVRDITRRLAKESNEPFFEWIRHIVTLAVGALTALIALQGHYLPRTPHLLWLLAIC